MQLSKNLAYSVLLSVSQLLFPLLTTPYITRILLPYGVSQVGFLDQLTCFIVVLAEWGIPTLAVREIAALQMNDSRRYTRVSELWSMHALMVIIYSLILGICLFMVWDKINNPYLILCSIIYYLSSVFNCEWYYWGTEKFKYIALRTICIRIVGVLAVFLCITKAEHVARWYFISTLLFVLISFINFVQLVPYIKFTISNLKKDIKACIPLYLITISHCLILMLDSVLLGITAGIAYVAFYAQAAKLVRISSSVVTDAFHALYARTSHVVVAATHHQQVLLRQSLGFVWLLAMPLSVGIFFFSHDFVLLYFGKNFNQVAPNVFILSGYPLLKSLNLFYSKQILLSHKKDAEVLKGFVIGAVVFVIVGVILCFHYRDVGCSVAVLLSEFMMLCYFIKCTLKVTQQIILPNYTDFFNLIAVLCWFGLTYWWVHALHFSLLISLLLEVWVSILGYLFLLFYSKNTIVIKGIQLFKEAFS